MTLDVRVSVSDPGSLNCPNAVAPNMRSVSGVYAMTGKGTIESDVRDVSASEAKEVIVGVNSKKGRKYLIIERIFSKNNNDCCSFSKNKVS